MVPKNDISYNLWLYITSHNNTDGFSKLISVFSCDSFPKSNVNYVFLQIFIQKLFIQFDVLS